MRKTVDQRVEQALKDLNIDREALARELGLGWPLPEPAAKHRELNEFIGAKVKAYNEDLRDKANAYRQQIRPQLAKQFGPLRKNDYVAFRLAHGKRQGRTIRGKIAEKTADYVVGGNQRIGKGELAAADRLRLDLQQASKLINEKVKEAVDTYRESQKSPAEVREHYADRIFPAKGYVRHDDRWVTPSNRLWQETKTIREREEALLRRKFEQEVFAAHGYRLVDGTWR